MFHRALHRRLLIVTLSLLTSLQLVPQASATTQTLVITGQALPTGGGAFGAPGVAALNDFGHVTFVDAQLTGTGGTHNNAGIFRAQQSSITQLARAGQSVMGGGTFGRPFHTPAINNEGTAVVGLHLQGRINSDEGIYRLHNGQLETVVSEGDAAPESGTFETSFGRTFESAFTNPTINPFGQTAFIAGISGSGTANDSGVFRADPADVVFPAEIYEIASIGDTAPNGSSVFAGFEDVSISSGTPFAGGHVSFVADLHPPGQPSVRLRGIYRGSVTRRTDVSVMEMALQGGNAAGRGTFGSLMSDPAMNDQGQVAFIASLAENSTPGNQHTGIFRTSGFSVDDIVVQGDPAPDGNGTFAHLVDPIAMNTTGQVAFRARLNITTNPGSDNEGIFVGNGFSLNQIARAGEPAPGGGVFTRFDLPSINLTGKLAFTASVMQAGQLERGVFFYDPASGLFDIARTGNAHAGSSFTSEGFAVAPSTGPGNIWNSGLNNNNMVAYSFSLNDGRLGIALWTQTLTLPDVDGDFNNNRRVEQGDLDLVLLNWGEPASPTPPDWASNPPSGFVDQDELDQVLLNWGFIRQSVAVPEPTTISLLLFVALFAAVARLSQMTTIHRRRADGNLTN